jgi:hypothetical protein
VSGEIVPVGAPALEGDYEGPGFTERERAGPEPPWKSAIGTPSHHWRYAVDTGWWSCEICGARRASANALAPACR